MPCVAPPTGWMGRAQRAHRNMIENLLPFAVLVLAVVIANKTNGTTAMAAQLFFWARVVHAGVYIAGVVWVRTLAFAGGLVAMVLLLIAALG